MVSGGCIISGSKVVGSLLFSSVRVHDYSTIDRSVILPRCKGRRALRDQKRDH